MEGLSEGGLGEGGGCFEGFGRLCVTVLGVEVVRKGWDGNGMREDESVNGGVNGRVGGCS